MFLSAPLILGTGDVTTSTAKVALHLSLKLICMGQSWG